MSESHLQNNEKIIEIPESVFFGIQADIASLKNQANEYLEAIAALKEMLSQKNSELLAKDELLKKYTAMLFGKKSERVILDDSQGILPGMEEILNSDTGKKEEESGKTKVVEHEREKKSPHAQAGWNDFPENLPREIVTISDPRAEAEGLKPIGCIENQRLVYQSAYKVQVLRRVKYAVPGEAKYGVHIAPLPELPSCIFPNAERCHYDASVIVHVISEKMLNHMPFYRQSQKFERLGISFGRSMMCDYFKKISDALTSLYDEMVKQIMKCPVLHADETRVNMLDPGGGKTKLCWIWVRKSGLGPPLTAMYFSQGRDQKTAREILGDYQGTIIRDGYDAAYGVLSAEVAGCWAHARRKFHEAQENHPDYARNALGLIQKLYKLEMEAKNLSEGGGEQMLFQNRRRLRKLARDNVRAYFELCRKIALDQPPKSAIAKAAGYSLERQKELERFLNDPRINIDNNPAENVIRPLCLGRKNWLFVGNKDGGTSMAVLSSFAATCKDNDVDFEKWLLSVVYLLDKTPLDKISTLLPHIWKQNQK